MKLVTLFGFDQAFAIIERLRFTFTAINKREI